MLQPVKIPGLLVLGTDTGVGKTLIAGTIADCLKRQGKRVAVCKPAATGCIHRREGLASEDAEFLAHCADTPHPLELICPIRFVEPLAPAIAAERAKEKIDWTVIDGAIQTMAADSDVMIIEGIGGVLTPMDAKHTFLDVADWLKLPAVIVARPGLGTINHTLLTCHALRSRGIQVAGVVINRYPPETTTVAEETNPRAIERWGKTQVLCLVPEVAGPLMPNLPADVVAAIDAVDWESLTTDKKSDA